MHDPADGRDDAAGDDDDDRTEDPWGAGSPSGPRTWVHPSELGMDQRGRSDRRRGSLLAGGLVIGGIGLLVAGMLMGIGWGASTDPSADPMDAAGPSIASLTIVSGGQRSTATGVVVDGDGHIAVHAGALTGATEVWVTCGGRAPERADIVAQDPQSDVAVLRVQTPAGRPATPAATPDAGQSVLMVRAGTGEEEPRSWTTDIGPSSVNLLRDDGSVSDAMFRTTPGGNAALVSTTVAGAAGSSTASSTGPGAPGSVTATDAADGAVFDARGRFLGLVVDAGDGGQAAVPATTVMTVARSLVSTGRVDRPWIGVDSVDVPGAAGRDGRSSGRGSGTMVTAVHAGGPAQLAGLQPGDVIVEVGDRSVARMVDLAVALQRLEVGSTTPMTIVRGGARRTVSITTAARPIDGVAAVGRAVDSAPSP